jgi:hypothetical protein
MVWRIVASLLLAGVPLLGGCLESKPSVAAMAGDPDIVAVKKFYSQTPWLSFDEAGDRNPEGFKVTLYLISARTGKGTFGDGDIIVSLYEHDPQRASRGSEPPPPVLAKQWVLDPAAALPFRAKRQTYLGYGHQLRLNWGDTDVLGKTIAINIDFRRRDGRLIRGQPQFFQVPARAPQF